MDWKSVIHQIAHDVETRFDDLTHRLDKRLGYPDTVTIQPYYGYGNGTVVSVTGRVLKQNRVKPHRERDTVWRNLLNTYRRFTTSELPKARVQAALDGNTAQVTADKEGYFTVTLPMTRPLTVDEMHLEVQLTVVGLPGMDSIAPQPTITATVIIPGTGARFGVISDIDDTVIKSDVLNLIKLARNTFLRNAGTRLPFEGVAGFYRALHHGSAGAINPMYYVSSSPWNLYDLLTDFFELREIPTGPLFLQDIGIGSDQFLVQTHGEHKLAAIQKILEVQFNLPFVLIGDSSQHDPEIYRTVVLENPGRIKAIYIRDVTRTDKRARSIDELAVELEGHNVPFMLVADTLEAARHAADMGLISTDELAAIATECEADKAPPNLVEQLLSHDDDDLKEET